MLAPGAGPRPRTTLGGMTTQQALGRAGEALAAEHLTAAGMRLVRANWRCRDGEIDLLMRDGDSLVAVEVKTRTSLNAGHPFEAITARKASRLRSLVRQAAADLGHRGSIRVDAVAILLPPDAAALLEHLKGIA